MTYKRGRCVTFRSTREAWGGLSNMAPGYALLIDGQLFRTVEALYQSLRFSADPHSGTEVQELIRAQRSPMAAKMIAKRHVQATRSDWDEVRVGIMDWCLRVKLHAHWEKFGALLIATEDLPIVEESHRDRFWGAVPQRGDPELLVGQNQLGILLERRRDEARAGARPNIRDFPATPMFLLGRLPSTATPEESDTKSANKARGAQAGLFDGWE